MDLSAQTDFSEQEFQDFKKELDKKDFQPQNQSKRSAPLAKRFAIVFVVISIIIIIVNLAVGLYFNPKTVATRELNALAEEYYEDYLYQNLIGDRTGDAIAEELQRYQSAGISNTYLRQLLLYDSGRRQNAADYFNQKGYTCDRNKTYVKYYPDPPYGKTDYHFTINLACE